MRRTSTLVSTARMPCADMLPDRCFHVDALRRALLGKDRLVNLARGIPPRSADDDLLALLVPFEHRPRADAELLANLGGHGNLPLRGQFRLSDRHNLSLPR